MQIPDPGTVRPTLAPVIFKNPLSLAVQANEGIPWKGDYIANSYFRLS
jgi:hypothetical protein